IYQSVDEIDDYNQEVERYEVFDILGRHVYTKKSVSKNMEEIRVTDLQSGIYIIRFLLKNGNVVTRKIIKN
ncbi:MAG: T9SS type A sorting domain-containing protein, partial [Bacteroidales bacterium]|nr:T9SS type A sorting domain-containing protein [Bacteroidales bacterium]